MSTVADTSRSTGQRNLLILGAVAIVVALITTSVELWIYRSSGDIYLDRSRPGFLPDEDEVKEEAENTSTYSYSETGPLDKEELETYLKELEKVEKHIKNLPNPYSPAPLSDKSLGISAT